jgi:hypothetical protein
MRDKRPLQQRNLITMTLKSLLIAGAAALPLVAGGAFAQTVQPAVPAVPPVTQAAPTTPAPSAQPAKPAEAAKVPTDKTTMDKAAGDKTAADKSQHKSAIARKHAQLETKKHAEKPAKAPEGSSTTAKKPVETEAPAKKL